MRLIHLCCCGLGGFLLACQAAPPASPRAAAPLVESAAESKPELATVPRAAEAGLPSPTHSARSYGFEEAAPGSVPAGFTLFSHGPGRPAVWQILAVEQAPEGNHVFAQLDDDDTNHRYNLALSPDPALDDVTVSVRGKAVSGTRDRSFGVVARWQPDGSYYLARCNTSPWGSNLRIYRFIAGARQQLAEAEVDAKPNEWYTLALTIRGDALTAQWAGRDVLSIRDPQIPAAGRCGVWTKAEAVSYFDALTVTPSR